LLPFLVTHSRNSINQINRNIIKMTGRLFQTFWASAELCALFIRKSSSKDCIPILNLLIFTFRQFQDSSVDKSSGLLSMVREVGCNVIVLINCRNQNLQKLTRSVFLLKIDCLYIPFQIRFAHLNFFAKAKTISLSFFIEVEK
jgi:hypothetical protein